MKAAWKSFDSAGRAAEFMTAIGPNRVITVHDLSHGEFERFLVWYWEVQ